MTTPFITARTLESVLLPSGLGRIGAHAFAGCTALRRVEFSDGYRSDPEGCPLEIGRRAFAGCTALTSIELPRTMHKKLGDYLFEGCASLVSATLPAVGGFGVFKGCKRLQEVTVGGVTFFASDWDEDYLSYVVMAARSDALDIRQGVIFDFAGPAKSTIYDWLAGQERHRERPFGCAVLPEGYRCTMYLGRCSRIGIIPKGSARTRDSAKGILGHTQPCLGHGCWRLAASWLIRTLTGTTCPSVHEFDKSLYRPLQIRGCGQNLG